MAPESSTCPCGATRGPSKALYVLVQNLHLHVRVPEKPEVRGDSGWRWHASWCGRDVGWSSPPVMHKNWYTLDRS